jgi:hypothetical protein
MCSAIYNFIVGRDISTNMRIIIIIIIILTVTQLFEEML